ncbi:MAG TPA: serine hydrolase [Blastocatellia bacterium]|nr:serine hydrolase [Blastocatellia bacterium]
MKIAFARILIAVLVLSQPLFGQSSAQARIQRVETGLLPPILIKGSPSWNIQERMKHYRVPGLSIAVINDFKIEWVKAYGVKDVETNEPVTAETLFQAGSISKPVAAMVALKKVADGKIALDENINNRLTTWKVPDNEFTAEKKVTLANLLSHTAGLTVHGFPGYAAGEKIPSLPEVLDGSGPANTAPVRVNLEPGTRFRYSGGGSTVAQLAIMDIEKKPYSEIARETVLGPLGMKHSTYSQPLPDNIRKQAASGHRGDGKPVIGKIHVYPEMAAAGLWTTPTDLARFAIEVQLSLAGKSNKVLSKEMAWKMVTPFIENHIGLGFFLEKHGEAIYFGHGGADEGFRAGLLVSRDKGYGVAVMVNSDNGQIINEIFRSVAREYQWESYLPQPYEVISIDSHKLNDYAGRFLVNPDRVLTVSSEAGRLYAQPTAEARFELLPISESEFIRQDAVVRYTFTRGASGKVEGVKVKFDGGESQAGLISKDVLIPYELLMAGKTDEAMEAYRKLKKERPLSNAISEGRLNNLGYSLLREKKLAEAVAVFKVNVELYPQSSNVYDSLGEAYMANGDKELAIRNYRKSLELDPRNKNAADMLKKLER